MTLRRPRQRELELTFREGDFVWVDDGRGGRLLARVRSSQSLKLTTGARPVFLVAVRYPKGWGTSEHREIKGVPTPAELARYTDLALEAST